VDKQVKAKRQSNTQQEMVLLPARFKIATCTDETARSVALAHKGLGSTDQIGRVFNLYPGNNPFRRQDKALFASVEAMFGLENTWTLPWT
jgi:hypothetical protein